MRRFATLFTVLTVFALILAPPAARAQTAPTLDDLAAAVVHLKTFINPDGRTVATLGTEREGSAIVIGSDGLLLTIGYLMVEAHSAEVITNDGRVLRADAVGYDYETGFGLLKTASPIKLRPIDLGKSADVRERDPVLVASFGGPHLVAAAHVVARRQFAGSWEYLLDDALFTAPPHPAWSGAALINRAGKLVGVGSLIVGDATGKHDGTPGNMFVPIDRLGPILADLITDGRAQGPSRPWLGLTTEEVGGRLLVMRVTPGSPAEKAGIAFGDVVVGVGGESAKSLPEFYRRMWAVGGAGATVPLDVRRNQDTRRIDVPSISRYDHLRLKSTF